MFSKNMLFLSALIYMISIATTTVHDFTYASDDPVFGYRGNYLKQIACFNTETLEGFGSPEIVGAIFTYAMAEIPLEGLDPISVKYIDHVDGKMNTGKREPMKMAREELHQEWV